MMKVTQHLEWLRENVNEYECASQLIPLLSQLELHRLNTGRQVRVVAANRLVKQMLFR